MSTPSSKPPRTLNKLLLPLGALSAGFGLMGAALAQTADVPAKPNDKPETVLPTVKAKAQAESAGKQGYQATETRIGKGKQELRDIPQSVTVVTEKLMDDRNLDDFRDVLRTTAGISFQAGETGEEDVRLRGFSLTQAGDVYVDGMRETGLIERDTFNDDRIEVLKGSASMLFGKGSTGGVVNQVSKQPFLMSQSEVNLSYGTGSNLRFTGDFNIKTGDSAALRINAMLQEADNFGARISKQGVAPTFRWGVGETDEFSLGFYYLNYNNRPNYNHPWFIVNGKIEPKLPARNYYGLASDYLKGETAYGTLTHTHRFADGGQLRTSLRHGHYERDLLVSAIGFQSATTPDTLSDATVLRRSPKGRVGSSDITTLQSDYTNKLQWLGMTHELTTGLDFVHESAKRNNNFTTGLAPAPTTTVGTPNDGASRPDTRGNPVMNTFGANSIGLYLQDMVTVATGFKLIGGLRFDRFKADYQTATTRFDRSDSLWSPRVGALYQPNEWASFHASYGTSFNTSADTYQFGVSAPANTRVPNTPPEKSRNMELGAKFDLLGGRLSLNTSLFRTEKYHERNTDPDSAAAQELLSGKRHATGLDLDIAGRITPDWEAFVSYTWIPSAKIDESNVALNAAGTGAQVKGDRPALTPKHSGSLWTTYRVLPKLRLGAGVTYRGEQNPEGARHVAAKAFATVDLMAEYTFSDKLSAKLNITNATNKLYADALYRGFYTPGAARAAQLTLKSTF
ncbi:TonB-dependent siderophore receptor [Pelomonas sp. CA6]|uniref:TonB-dependent receptor n=1 Tax=Pelomonas sp. CA6 TaxID=2907999 RepID=UPI001F4C1C11|nr:TonB-dependent siderophore receptor [Pelomonas sp. CA6]MCH7343607.1 TonB-dependent siderophore receptor [Pelomonas sp. CA6]